MTSTTPTVRSVPQPQKGPRTSQGEGVTPLILLFREGNRDMADLLGGKGAGLAEMTRLGMPVPPGFTVTTEACRQVLRTGEAPEGLWEGILTALADLEAHAGRRLGDPADPLLLSVRSGARFSMPGMMETVLDIGMNDEVVAALVARGEARFAWDSYRRLAQMYGRTVLGIEGDRFESLLTAMRQARSAATDADLDAGALEALTREFRMVIRDATGHDLPQDPREQLRESVWAVFGSWNSDRARRYRAHEGIPDDLGTAVNVMQMVFGNRGDRSGSGVCFTRDPATGAPGAYGDYLPNAQGEDVVSGVRTPMHLAELGRRDAALLEELTQHLERLERHYRDLCDVEFTVEEGHLYILQTRLGKRSPGAAFRIAVSLVDEGVITLDEALTRVTGLQLQSLLHPRFAVVGGADASAGATAASAARGEAVGPLGRGLPASPGASAGQIALDPATAERQAAAGVPVVLVRPETSADDFGGMVAAKAVVTARGGMTSHAAVVARGLGRTCVVGVDGLVIDAEARTVTFPSGRTLDEGATISVDGTSGVIYEGELEIEPSILRKAIEEGGAVDDPTTSAALRLLAHADQRARLEVHANAETEREARTARALGARGIGLARTEHMLLGDRRTLVEAVVLDDGRDVALAEIESLAREEFSGLLRIMDGLPVVVRLLDPPLHEFLPDVTELSVAEAVAAAVAAERGEPEPAPDVRLAAVKRWREVNPMLGLRGVRLLTVVPEIVDAQVRALAQALVELRAEGLDPQPHVMVPLVAHVEELRRARTRIEAVIAQVAAESGTELSIPIGVMIELPRAALTAAKLADEADFFSFGTNDLTQTTWGISRDDAEASFLAAYREEGLIDSDPFETVDEEGVGALVSLAAREGRRAHPGLGLAVCGEQGGDPGSVAFFAGAGIEHLSCSPPRIPVVRLEVGRQAVLSAGAGSAADTR